MNAAISPPMGAASRTLQMLLRYKAWANEIIFAAVRDAGEESLKARMTTFGNMVHTLNHVYVVDDIFRHHLTGRRHSYTMRNTQHIPPLGELWSATREMDEWYLGQVAGWTEQDMSRVVHFEFVGGGAGALTQEEIILHLVNHATYHRGFVGDMLKQVPWTWPATDLTVFLRGRLFR